MSLNGKATAKNVLRGSISALTVYVTDAYAIALQNGFEGTVEEWLESLRGEDGVSPVVEVAVIEGGHRVTITDRNGSHIYDVYDGVDGVSPVVNVEETEDGHLVTITDKNGDHPYNVTNGKDGVNVSITKISENAEDDGYSTVEFSNGSVLKIKNGSKGETGAAGTNGTSISIVSVTESTADGGSNIVTFSDGSTLTVKNGESGSITVDSELSATSENPLQNKVIAQMAEVIKENFVDLYGKVNNKQDKVPVPTSVNMSGYDSGTIVETFADGTTKTTTIEFDADGNPTKITDGDGNVATYTW